MTALFLAALALSLGVRLWLSIRQARHVQRNRDAVPAAFRESIQLDSHRKAAAYTIARVRFGRVATLWRAAVLLLFTLGGGLELLAQRLDGTLLILGAMFLVEFCTLPLSLYSTFVLEERFGFNRTTPRLYALDVVKGVLLGLVIGAPLAYGALWLVRSGGAFWWIWLWAGWVAVSLFLAWAYPVLIAPLFHKFTPLEDSDLRRRISDLCERTGFQSEGIFVMDGSRRSSHANAYFTGFGKKKRIVLFDTLREMLTPGEAEAVLAHELGHFRLHHVWWRLAAGAAMGFLGIALLALLMGRAWFHEGLGVPTGSPAATLVLFAWVAPLFTFLLRPLLSAWSRRHEYAADAFAAAHSDGEAMVRALVKLYEHNAATLTPDPLHSAFHDSHPPAPLRIARLTGGFV